MTDTNTAVPIDSIDSFAAIVEQWHEKNKATLEHTMKIPVGTTVEFDSRDPVVLEGDLHKGFRLGIAASLVAIGNLPFFTDEPSNIAPDVVQSLSPSDA